VPTREQHEQQARDNVSIQQRPELDEVFEDYRKLQDVSRDTRYECFDPTPAEVAHYRQHVFGRLEAHLLALLRTRESG
jgi:hypothetical protein